jgi:hypothetical protein
MKKTISRYQSRLWKYFRNTFLIVGTYFSGLLALEISFPLVLWISLEATLRYFPRWLQMAIFIFLGLQIDWWQQWSLGTGLILISAIWLGLLVGRSLKQGELFFLWQMSLFLAYMLVMMRIIPTLTTNFVIFQVGLYSATLLIRLFAGKRV